MSETVSASFITDLNIVETLQTCLAMQPYNDHTAAEFQISSTDDWLWPCQGLALPVLPPTTLEACWYFFVKVWEYAALAIAQGKGKLDYKAFTHEWNQSADGKDQFYITSEVLATYAKVWDKVNNIHASQEMIKDKINLVPQSHDIFAASHPQSQLRLQCHMAGYFSFLGFLHCQTWTSEIPQSEPTIVTNV